MSPRKRKPRSSGNVHSIKPCTLFKAITRAPKTRSKSQKLTSGCSKQKSSNMSELDWDDGSKFKVVVWKGEKPRHNGEVQGDRLGVPRGTAVESGTSFSNETVTKGTKREGIVAEVANKPGSEWGIIRCRTEKEDADTSKSISSNSGRLMVESAAKGRQAQSVEHDFIDDTELKGRLSRSASCLSLDMVPSEADNSLDSTFDDENLSMTSSEASDLSLEATFILLKRLRKIRTRLAESEAAVQASDAAVQAAFENMHHGPSAGFWGWKNGTMKTPKPKRRFDRFMNLPLEIRMMIYEYLLVVGKVFRCARFHDDPRYTGTKDFDRPNTQLFVVSQQIRKEAEKLFYSKNLFVVPRGLVAIGQSDDDLFGFYIFPQANLQHVRSLSVCFDARDLEPTSHWSLVSTAKVSIDQANGQGYFDSLTPDERQQIIHTQAENVLQGVAWAAKFGADFKSLTLNLLQVDLSRAYCSYGCHRYAAEAARLLGPFDKNPPKRIEVFGVESIRERNDIWTNVMGANNPHKPAIYFPDCPNAKEGNDDGP